MVNATFEDRNHPDFDPEVNTDRFILQVADYVAHGVRAFTLNLQGGMPGYEAWGKPHEAVQWRETSK